MSIQCEEPFNDEMKAMMQEMFGEPEVKDNKTALYNDLLELQQQKMKELANVAGQPVTAEFNSIGEIKELSDGTKYEVTNKGWKKI